MKLGKPMLCAFLLLNALAAVPASASETTPAAHASEKFANLPEDVADTLEDLVDHIHLTRYELQSANRHDDNKEEYWQISLVTKPSKTKEEEPTRVNVRIAEDDGQLLRFSATNPDWKYPNPPSDQLAKEKAKAFVDLFLPESNQMSNDPCKIENSMADVDFYPSVNSIFVKEPFVTVSVDADGTIRSYDYRPLERTNSFASPEGILSLDQAIQQFSRQLEMKLVYDEASRGFAYKPNHIAMVDARSGQVSLSSAQTELAKNGTKETSGVKPALSAEAAKKLLMDSLKLTLYYIYPEVDGKKADKPILAYLPSVPLDALSIDAQSGQIKTDPQK